MNPHQYFAYRSFWPEIETMKRFRECGVTTFSYMVSNGTNSLGLPYTKYPPVWKWHQTFDFDAFDRQTGDILEAIPDARLICMVDLNAPHWWVRYLGAYGVRYDTFYELGKISAFETWKKETTEYLQALLTHAETKYGSSITAYVLGCGGATEWHDRSRGEESIYRLRAWIEWQKRHGKDPVDIPGRLIRETGSHDFEQASPDVNTYFNGADPTGCHGTLYPNGPGLFRTPHGNGLAIDYWKFCNELNGDTILYYLKKAREVIRPEAELGMFYGYIMGQLGMVSTGHLEYERICDQSEVNFLMAPISYAGRAMGAASASSLVRGTIRHKGKRVLQEMDQRTYTSNRRLSPECELPDPLKVQPRAEDSLDAKKFSMAPVGVWKDDDEIVAGMRRDAAFALIHGDSLWWFDMWGGFYKGDRVFAALKQLKDIWDRYSNQSFDDRSEILLVVDPENMYLVNDLDARCGAFFLQVRTAVGLSGVPYSVCSFKDLETIDLSSIRLVVFCHPFQLNKQKRAMLDNKVFTHGRSALWIYGGGIIDDTGKWNPDNCAEITGIPFGEDGLEGVIWKGGRSFGVHRPGTLTPDVARQMAIRSGCHCYNRQGRPVYVNDRLLAIHSPGGETLEINFPRPFRRAQELFSGITFDAADSISVAVDGPETFLFDVSYA